MLCYNGMVTVVMLEDLYVCVREREKNEFELYDTFTSKKPSVMKTMYDSFKKLITVKNVRL
jgi:hypothetical protein